MTEKREEELDRAIAALAREAGAASPSPGPELVARVLADAAAVSAGRPAPTPAPARPRAGVAWPGSLRAALFGWASGAVACMVLGLALGIGLGLEMDTQSMPLLDGGDAQDEMPLALASAEPSFLPVDGL